MNELTEFDFIQTNCQERERKFSIFEKTAQINKQDQSVMLSDIKIAQLIEEET